MLICTYIRLKTTDILRVCAYFPGKIGDICGIGSNSRPQLILRLSKVVPCFDPEALQLRYVDRVGAFRTGSDIDNLAGNFFVFIPDRNGRFGRFPYGRIQISPERIISLFTDFATEVVVFYLGLAAQRYAVRNIRSGFRTEGHRVLRIGYRLIPESRSVVIRRIGAAADRRSTIS